MSSPLTYNNCPVAVSALAVPLPPSPVHLKDSEESLGTIPVPLESMNAIEELPDSYDPTNDNDVESHYSYQSEEDFNEEPFRTFQDKAALLATQLFPGKQKITVEHVNGGTYNRVVGLAVSPPSPKKYTCQWFMREIKELFGRKTAEEVVEYILRIPRYNYLDLEGDISALAFIGSRLDLPIPRALHFDLSSNNAIGHSYMLQPRLPGEKLSIVFDGLNLAQTKCIARQVTRMVNTIAAVTSDAGGRLPRTTTRDGLNQPNENEIPSRIGFPFADEYESGPAVSQTPKEFLFNLCKRWCEWDRRENDGEAEHENIWQRFASIVQALDALGFLDRDNIFYLCHGDLQPYNFLARYVDEENVAITGVMDWDSAEFAPSFMPYKAPYWMWYPAEAATGDFDKEESALIEPSTDDARALKQVFIENASPEFLKYAFAPEALLARRMFALLKHGLPKRLHADMARAIIREWNELHPDPDFDSDSDEDSDTESDDDDSDDESDAGSDAASDAESDVHMAEAEDDQEDVEA